MSNEKQLQGRSAVLGGITCIALRYFDKPAAVVVPIHTDAIDACIELALAVLHKNQEPALGELEAPPWKTASWDITQHANGDYICVCEDNFCFTVIIDAEILDSELSCNRHDERRRADGEIESDIECEYEYFTDMDTNYQRLLIHAAIMDAVENEWAGVSIKLDLV